jgi:hypothetical protein
MFFAAFDFAKQMKYNQPHEREKNSPKFQPMDIWRPLARTQMWSKDPIR